MFEKIIDIPSRPNLLPADTLAYIGDVVFELFVRNMLLEKVVAKPNQLHKEAIGYVNASAQASFLDLIKEDLNEVELAIVRRGRNIKTGVPKNANPADYKKSTAFEALIGYLYLAGEESRLIEIFNKIRDSIRR